MDSYIAPPQVMAALSASGVQKVSRKYRDTLLLAVLAGIYIGFASQLAMVAGTGEIAWVGAKKILMGGVFSVGLMFVLIPGADLFTGNTLITIPLFEKKVTLAQMLRNWGIVYGGNFIGAVALALLIGYGADMLSADVGTTMIETAVSKTSHTWYQIFFRGIGANWLVCLAVWFAYASKSLEGKILGIFFPVMAFVAMGFDHSIANMFILSAGKIALAHHALSADTITWAGMGKNLLFSTIGNIIGGGLFVGGAYWRLHLKDRD